jgi:outer membrane biosynthesis protein TonB
MDKAFDKAAEAAAKNLKFTPAVHKKSKQPVSQAIMVEYTFKP